MDRGIARKWAEELRSGYYEQGSGVLKEEVTAGKIRYCCLGVLCEMAIEAGVILEALINDDLAKNLGRKEGKVFSFDDGDEQVFGQLPHKVMEWAEVKDCDGFISDKFRSLSEMNDDGRTFAAIANVIDDHVEEI